MAFSDQIAVAKARKRSKLKDVPVCLDGELAEQREALLGKLENAQAEDAFDQRLAGGSDRNARPIQDQLDAIAEAAAASLVTLRFYQLPGDEWTMLTSLHPVRLDSVMDRQYGYNIDAVIRAAVFYKSENGVQYGFRLDGDTEHPLTVEDTNDLFHVLSGSEIAQIRDAVYALNEYDPAKRVNALVKGFGVAARSEKK